MDPREAKPIASADNQAEIHRLKEELTRVTKKRDILKPPAVATYSQRM